MSNNNIKRKIEEYKNLFIVLFQTDTTYHDQKENIIYICLLFECSLLAGILSFKEWPPCWFMFIINSYIFYKIISILIFLIIIFFIQIFIRYQLRNKRWANIMCKSLEIGIIKCINKKFKESDFKQDINQENNKKLYKILYKILDSLIPIKKNILISGIEKHYPLFLVEIIKQQRNGKIGILYEWLISISSIIILTLICLYTFL